MRGIGHTAITNIFFLGIIACQIVFVYLVPGATPNALETDVEVIHIDTPEHVHRLVRLINTLAILAILLVVFH
jgi:hypothetical protein